MGRWKSCRRKRVSTRIHKQAAKSLINSITLSSNTKTLWTLITSNSRGCFLLNPFLNTFGQRFSGRIVSFAGNMNKNFVKDFVPLDARHKRHRKLQNIFRDVLSHPPWSTFLLKSCKTGSLWPLPFIVVLVDDTADGIWLKRGWKNLPWESRGWQCTGMFFGKNNCLCFYSWCIFKSSKSLFHPSLVHSMLPFLSR